MLLQVTNLGMVLCGALIIYKVFMLLSNSESPVVVVLSGSMEPGIRRGDLLVLSNWNSPIQTGEVVVYKVKEREIPIVHRVLKVHDHGSQLEILTKGDNNMVDDRGLYRTGQLWLNRSDIMGRAFFIVPYAGMVSTLNPPENPRSSFGISHQLHS
mmetsp:Transcript_16583/g.33970  ORF Transcript_16583/g.33970 Transcript_16583/m.33970 type:complete len:155 (-) Transcript_16583:1260-1724(-)